MNETLKALIDLQLKGLDNLDSETIKALETPLIESERLLISELNSYSEDQYSYRHRIQTLRSIDHALNRMNALLGENAESFGKRYSELGREIVRREISAFEPTMTVPNLEKDLVSIEQNKFLINNAKASIETYTTGVRAKVSNAVTQAVLSRKTGYEVTGRLSKYMQVKKWRVVRIFRTEMHKIQNSTKLLSYGNFKKNHFPDLKKRLYHPMDNRTGEDSIQLKNLDPVVEIGKPFVFKYRRVLKSGIVRVDRRVFMVPPDRPNDRSVMVPWRPKWKED